MQSAVGISPPPEGFIDTNLERKDYDVCYCGIISDAFGHILLETISRLWYILNEKPYLKCVFLTKEKPGSIFFQFCELLEIDKSNIEIIEKPTQYRTVYVPESSFYLNGYAAKEYIDIIDKL